MDVLHPLSAGLIRGIHIDSRHQFTESIRGEFFNMNVLVRFLDELLNILDLLFLYFDFLMKYLPKVPDDAYVKVETTKIRNFNC